MTAYWCVFEGRKPACVEVARGATTEDARALAEQLAGAKVTQIDPIPYPAVPRLNEVEFEWNGRKIKTPSFCYAPHQCRNRSACPQSYACTE